MTPNFVGVTGLPRSGSTLLCQMLAMHPEIRCENQSSPLCNVLLGIRRMASDDQFLLSQLDNRFDASYAQLKSAMTGFLRGWCDVDGESNERVAVDKNRAWLHCVELLLTLAPEAKLVVCVRELGQIYCSIEAQHQKTILLDFNDHLGDFDRFGRADILFAKDKAIGAPLISLHAVPDLPRAVQERLYFVRYEDLMAQPAACMSSIFKWLGVSALQIDPEALEIGIPESDSHYRMKYRHTQSNKITPPKRHVISPRIQAHIENAYAWFYQTYYPKKP